MNKIRVLLTGSNGLVGQNVLKQLLQKGKYKVLATSFSSDKYPDSTGYEFVQLDIGNREAVLSLAGRFQPEVIVHCAAMTQVDPCELDQTLAYRINVEGTRNFTDLARQCRAHFILVSTDFVFDGEKGPYREEDDVAPVSYYGQTKVEAEGLTRELPVPWSIVRTILVYGLTPSMSRSNLVTWVKNSLEDRKTIRVVNDQFRMPTLVDDLAWGITEIVARQATGIYHLSGPDMHSVFDLARMVALHFGLDEQLIHPISSGELSQPGKRPPKTGFILNKAAEMLDYHPKSFLEGLAVVQNLLVTLNKT